MDVADLAPKAPVVVLPHSADAETADADVDTEWPWPWPHALEDLLSI